MAMALILSLVAGAAFAAVKVGNNGPNRLVGTANNDTLRGFGGNDRLFGKGDGDRLLGSRFGTAAVETLAAGEPGVMIGLKGDDHISTIPLAEVVGKMPPLDLKMYRMAGVLAELPE